MVVTRLIGGLGNQMFQYSMARSYALRKDIELKLDIRDLTNNHPGNYTLREFELSHFNIEALIASETDVDYFKKDEHFLVEKVKRKILPQRYLKLIKEKNSKFNPGILKLSGNKYFDGYWQCEEYFMDIRDILLQDFTLKNNENISHLQPILSEIHNSESVSLHVRRGDYVQKYSNYYYLQSPEYYKSAIQMLKKQFANLKVFIFSDDIQWAIENLKLGVETVYIPPNKSYEDIFLMSHCKHSIIANSSFSWWGAWLNQYPDKICIAPKQWYKDPKLRTDIIPQSWVKLGN